MNFLIGFSLTIPLLIFTLCLWFISKRLPGEFILSLIAIMIFGDGILAGVWYFGIGEEMTNMKQFRLGCGFSFFVSSFSRALYFMVQGYFNEIK